MKRGLEAFLFAGSMVLSSYWSIYSNILQPIQNFLTSEKFGINVLSCCGNNYGCFMALVVAEDDIYNILPGQMLNVKKTLGLTTFFQPTLQLMFILPSSFKTAPQISTEDNDFSSDSHRMARTNDLSYQYCTHNTQGTIESNTPTSGSLMLSIGFVNIQKLMETCLRSLQNSSSLHASSPIVILIRPGVLLQDIIQQGLSLTINNNLSLNINIQII